MQMLRLERNVHRQGLHSALNQAFPEVEFKNSFSESETIR